ncbi:hypothetical protein V1478_004404 [Vespula squamosa]|uniref:Uncharacterized protein n=1 Tax=Vespula squamosa TaxID=30214 RepID=A0ABD2BG31_VESSQ
MGTGMKEWMKFYSFERYEAINDYGFKIFNYTVGKPKSASRAHKCNSGPRVQLGPKRCNSGPKKAARELRYLLDRRTSSISTRRSTDLVTVEVNQMLVSVVIRRRQRFEIQN